MAQRTAVRADAQRNRANILAAAGDLLGRRGTGASTEAIAAAAGVGVATVFRHFPTKDALVRAVVQERLDAVVDTARRVHEEASPDGFALVLRMLLTEIDGMRALGDVLGGGGIEALDANSAGRELWMLTAGLIEQGVAAGTLRDDLELDDVRALVTGAKEALRAIGAGWSADDDVRWHTGKTRRDDDRKRGGRESTADGDARESAARRLIDIVVSGTRRRPGAE